MKMKKNQKIAFLAAMSLSILAIVAAFARLISYIRLDITDYLYEFYFLFMNFQLELASWPNVIA